MSRLPETLVLVAMVCVVAAGPTVRRDELTNVVTKAEAESASPSAPTPTTESVVLPAKLPLAADEPAEAAGEGSSSTRTPEASSSSPPETTTTTTTTEAVTTSGRPSTTGSPTTQSPATTKPPRKTITFDQRQEGKYNIRADLENFVIVVVPSGSSSGASLLDLLTRTAQKKRKDHHYHHHETRKNSQKRKNNKAQYGAVGQLKKAGPPQPVTPEVIVLDENNQRSSLGLETEEFIEGRTPYKVDLSSSARSVDGAGRPTDVGHRDAEASGSVATFQLSVIEPSTGGRVRFPSATGNYYPLRALRTVDRGFANTNTLVEATNTRNLNHLNQLPGDGARQQQPERPPQPQRQQQTQPQNPAHPADGHAEAPVVTAAHSHLPSSFDSLEYAPLRPDVDMTQLQLQPDGTGDDEEALQQQQQQQHYHVEQRGQVSDLDQDGWDELRLLGAQEQCGPDRKRDSYGVCQFVRP